MTLELALPPELERRLAAEANRRGISPDKHALELLEKHLLPFHDSRAELVQLLQSWLDAYDTDAQKETGECLLRALDEDRPSDRKLFPPELEGVTW